MSVETLQPYLYTDVRYPKITKFPLHAATYNGREQKVLRLLDHGEHCLYQTASDEHDADSSTALFVALARRHAAIADHFLEIYATDLATIQRHFEDILPQRASTRFWLRERILVAFGKKHVDYVLDAAKADVHADPAVMGPERSGLFVLLKPTNRTCAGVVWLSARQPGADRTIARIVGRIYERGGELSVPRKETFGCTLFDVAARLNLPTVWHRMHRLFGVHLTRRECVRSFRYLAEYEDTDDNKRTRFDELCRTVGRFEVAELFDGNSEVVNFVFDAITDYKHDHTILEHLLHSAAQTQKYTNIIDTIVLERGCERSLLSVAFQLEDKRLPWILLKCRPDLVSCCTEWWDTPVNRFISQRPFDQQVHDLIVEQFSSIVRNDDFRMGLLSSLITHNWIETVREIYRIDPSMKDLLFRDRELGLSTLGFIAGNHHFGMLTFLLSEHEIKPAETVNIFARIFHKPMNGLEIPTELYTLFQKVDAHSLHVQYADLLEASLAARNVTDCRRLMDLAPDVNLKDILNSRGENLLFPAVYNYLDYKRSPDYDYIDTESPEFIDEEDDDESIARKQSLNRQRNQDPIEWKNIIDVNPTLERECQQLFQELLDSGFDWRQLNSYGKNLAHVAVERNNLVVLKLLLDLGIDASLPDGYGQRPMHYVKSKDVFDLLPAADVNCLNSDGENVLMKYLKIHWHCDCDYELMEQMISAGLDVGHQSSSGDTALHLARSSRLMKLLLDAGADVNAQNLKGETPSHSAFKQRVNDAIEQRRLLFAHPDHDVFRCTKAGVSLLSELVQLSEADFGVLRPLIGEEKLTKLFATHCANPTAEGCSIMELTEQDDDNMYCLRKLLEAAELNADPASFRLWLYADDDGRRLIECGAHINNRSDKRPLDWSGYRVRGTDRLANHLAQLDVFVAAGINLEVTNVIGETALQWYGAMGDEGGDRTRNLARLLEAGANYRLLTTEGVRALEKTVFRSLYEWDEEKDEGILQQVFKPMYPMF